MSTNDATVVTEPQLERETWPLNYVGMSWLVSALKRQDDAILGALLSTWTGLPLALFGAVAGLVFGAVVGAIGLSVGGFAGSVLNQGTSLLGAMLGAVVGAGVGAIFIYVYLVSHPAQLFGALLSGVLVSAVIFYVTVAAEPLMLWLRGYRQPSRREKALLDPLLFDLAQRMRLPALPAMWISDAQKPGAWTHTRAIVVTRGLLGEYDASEGQPKPDLDTLALSAILAHELHHWMKGDAVGLAMVSACFYPFVLLINGVAWLRERAEWLAIVLWLFLWPIWVTSRFVVIPLMAKASRRAEYEADRHAAMLGEDYRLALRRALDDLAQWERPRNGWEAVLAASHPPIEYRLERLEASRLPQAPS